MRIKWLNLLVLTAMVLGLFPVGVSAAPAADAPVIVEVEPALRQQLQADEGTGYLIYFHERPDLSKAYAMDWITRGRFVTAALQATAERSQARVRAYLDAQGADYQAFWIDNVIAVEKSNLKTFNTLTTAFPEVEALRAHRQLQLYEATETASPAMTSSAIEPNILHVLADQVWAEGYTGQGIVVASVDTGVRYTHDALVNHYRGNLGGGTFDHNYNWWDPYGNHPTAPGDDNGHGTHTMGTMVGDDGGANQIGMAPGAKWVACRGCNTSSCTDTALLECAEFFAAPWDLTGANANPDKRPNAVNNSWGDCSTSYDPWYQGVVDAWHAAGIYPVFSNGNASNCGYPAPPGLNTVGNPARYGNVTGVGSSGRDNGQYATHSNWGPTDNPDTVNPKPGWADLKPQVLAPGVNIRSSVNSGDSAYQGGWSGTSMSAPHVTGLVALMWSAAPCLIGDYATTETLIEDTATPIPYDDGTGSGAHVPNYAAGWGEINALAAVEAAAASCGDSAIVGQVTDATTSAPIAGATVVATNEVAQRQATSNAEGLYALTVFSGTYTLTASRYGYQTTVIPDVSATTGTTTTQNIALTPAAMYEVSGKVTDATTGWPLYAHISISGDPVDPFPPDNSVWTNPATGEYSLMLAEGVTYTLEVEAWVDGYGVGTGEVGPLTADAPHTDFALQPDMVACTAPGYHFVGGLMANFEDKTFPPAGWTVVNNGGTCDWAGDDPGGRGNLTGGTGKFAVADSDACGSGSTMNTDLVSPPFDVSGLSQVNLSFAYDYNNYTAGEVAAVDVSANNGASWVNVVTWTTDQRGPATFSQNVTGILAGSTQARVRFHYYAPSWDWWWEVDNVVLGNPVCQAPTDGGLVVGNVYDANFPTLALNGATVVNATGGETTAKATPADAAVDDAFYTLFAPSGAQALTATMTGGYAPDTATVTVVDGGTVEQDFQLPAGLLEATPAGIATTVELGYADSATLTLANTGDANATFELKEHEGRFVPLHIEAYTGELQSDGAPVSTGLAPRKAASVGPVAPTASPLADAAPAFAIDLSTGDLGTFMSDAPGAWTDIGPVGLDGPFAGDFLGGDFSQMYVLDYYANTLYVVDTATGVATEIGTSTPQSGQVWTGMTGFVDGTLYAASTDGGQSYLYTVDPATGATTVVGEITNAPVIIDIAINADGEMYGVDIGSDVLVAIDPATGAGTVVGSLGYNANYAQGMDFEEESGVLYWAAYGTSGELRIIDTETGASTSVGAFPGGTEVDCLAFATGGTADVPWLTETPVSGNVPAQGNVPVTLGFDAAYVDQPGEYHAELIVKNDTPYGKFSVPVTMTVEAPTSWGQLTGTVTGLGVCDGDPAPLEEAEVVVESATTGQTWTLATDENGAYTLWLDQAHSPLTITVTAPDYFGETGGVVVKQGKTTVVDFNLRLLKPCLSYDPADFDVTLPMGNNTVEPLTLSNTGAGTAEFELVEIVGGFIPMRTTAGYVKYLPMPAALNGPVNTIHNGTLSNAESRAPYIYYSGAPQAVSIIAYADDDQHTPTAVERALQALGLSYTFYGYDSSGANLSAFVSAVQAGGWDLVIYAADSWALIDASDYTAVANHVASGGMAVAQSWAIGYDATHQNHTLWSLLGGSYAGWLTSPASLYWWNPAHPIFSGVPEFTNLNNLGYTAYGARMNLVGDPDTGLGGFTTTPANGQAGVILSNANRTIYKGLTDNLNSADVDSDGTWDVTEWWTNAVNYILNPGEFGGGIPWLTETPISGTLAADTHVVVDLGFDAGVPETMQPGTYYGALKVASDAANDVPNIPITLTVTPPESWGKIAGVVTGLGYCDVATPTLLAGAVVTLTSGTGLIEWTLATDENGAYQLWLDEAHSPVTITVAYPDHVTQVLTKVEVTAGATTVADAALRWAKPCLTVDPDMFNVSVTLGTSATVPFSLTNLGAAGTAFNLTERNGGWIISRALFEGAAVNVSGNAMRLGPTTPRSGPSLATLTADVIQDGSFEDGTPNAFWNEYSTNFGTPICDVPSCGTGTGTGPRTGDFWVWFGGIGAYEEGSVDQDVTIPAGFATLSFWLEQIVCGSPTDYMQVLIDGNEVFATDGTSPICGVLGYSEVVVDVTDYADGGVHNVMFYSESDAGSNIFVDDVVLDVLEGVTVDIPWLFEDPESGAVAADSTSVVDLTFDASSAITQVTQPGEYFGTLFVNSDDPVHNKIAVPVTMTVTPPATWGKLLGTVTGLGYCDADPHPLAGAEVLVESWMTHTTTVMGTFQQEDFEATDGGYTHSGTADEWAWGTPTAWPNACASGTRCWGTDLAGNYENSSNQTLQSPVIDLSSFTPGDALTVAWQQAWSTESGWDYAYAEVSINGGAWTQMWSGAGTGNPWTEKTYDISGAAGGTVQFRWRLTSDSSSTYPGYYIDNVRILGPVEIVEPVNWPLTTDVSGTYQVWIDEMYSPVTITVSYPEHEKGEAIAVITGGNTTTQDFDLRWLVPCVQADPLALHTTLELGATASEVLTLTNAGAVDTAWSLTEENLGDPTATDPGVVTLFTEAFEGAFPPASWTRVENIGSCDWESSATTGYTNHTGGTGLFADANSDWCGGAMDAELWSPAVDLSTAAAPILRFQSDYRDLGDDGYVDVSTDGGTTWTNLLHYDGVAARGPLLVQLDLSAYAGQPSVIIRFHYVASGWDWYWQVDDVQIADVDPVTWLAEAPASGVLVADTGEQVVAVDFDASVVEQPGDYLANLWVHSDDPFAPARVPVTMTVTPPATWGELRGTVTSLGRCDANPAPLEGATVVIVNGTSVTLTTDVNGAYSYWLPAGTYTVTVAAADHVGDAAVVTVPAAGEVTQDFSLTWLGPCVTSITPSSMEVTVAMGMSETLPLTMTNAGAGPLNFAFLEANGGFVPTLRTLAPYQPPAVSGGQAHNLLQHTDAAVVYGSSPAPLAPSASVLLNQPPNQVNGLFSDVGCDICGGAQVIAENFTLSEGKLIGQIVFWTGYFSTDTPINPDTLTVIFHSDDAGLPGAALYTEANVAYERVQTGVVLFGVHEWKHTLTLGSPVALPPGNYWIEIYNDTGFGTDDFFWETGALDPANGLAGSAFALTAPGSGWNYDAGTDLAIQLLEVPDIPWLFEDPESGAVPPATDGVADITFDAGVPEVTQPGTYAGLLTVNNNDPVWDGFSIPVTMHVTLPPTYGQITGAVTGLGPCDDPAIVEPLEGVTVTIASATQTWTLTTDAAGGYLLWLDEAHSPVTLTVEADGYVTGVVTGVPIISGTTTVQDVALRPKAPCFAGVTPAEAHVTVALGVTATLPITVVNTGGGALSWSVKEADGGFQILALSPAADVLVVAYDTTAATSMETALTHLGYTYLRVTRDAFQAMAVADLLEYQAVLYAGNSTGDSWAKARAYLDAGGSFLIADNDLGWSQGGTVFYQTYLQSTYVSDAGSDGQLTGLDIMTDINPNISADPWPDDFTVGAEGTCIFDAPSPNCAGVKVERLGYKAIYLAWDFQYSDGFQDAILGVAVPWLAGGGGVPWLDEDPTSGTVAPDAKAPVTLTFDASVPEVTQPGDYYATLTFEGAGAKVEVPVTMTVEPPATWGKLEGLVQGLGHCNVMTAPLESAVVFVESAATPITWTLETDADGMYGVWMDEAYSPFTVTVSYEAGYEAQVFTDVAIISGTVTTVNANLIWLQPCLTVAPDALALTVTMGTTGTLDLNLANLGAITGTFVITEQSLGFEILGPLATGGSDAFGYEFADSNSAGVGPVYGFVDISGIGTPIALGDNDYAEVPIGFDFKFYGKSATEPNVYDSVFVGSNGFLSFGAGSTDLSPDPALPDPTLPNNLIAAAWDNLVPGTVYVQSFAQCPYNPSPTTLEGCFIVQYDDFSHAGGAPAGTWEVILFHSGNILLQYEDVSAPNATTGIEDRLGLIGLTYGPTLADELAICFAYPGEKTNCQSDQVPWLATEVTKGKIAAYDDATIAVTFDASVPEVSMPGDYLAELWIASNDPVNSLQVIPVTMTVTQPTTMGRLAGVVSGWSHCDTVSETLAGAQVVIATSDGKNVALTTDADGAYAAWLPVGPYTLTVSAEGYVPVILTGAVQPTMQSRSVDLRLDAPCVSVTYDQPFDVVVVQGQRLTRTLTLNNRGAGRLTYNNVLAIGLWLTVDPKAGSVAPDSAQSVNVIFDATGLDVGVYNSSMEIVHNDTKSGQLFIRPIRMTVVAQGTVLTPVTDAKTGNPGETVTYVMTVTNSIATAVTFDIAATGNVWTTTAPATVTVAANGTVTFTVDVDIPADAHTGDSDTVIVKVTSQGADGQVGEAVLQTTVAEQPVVLALTKAANPADYVLPGDTITYTLTLANNGNDPLTIALTDTIPAGVTYVAGSATGGASLQDPPGAIVWKGVLANGAQQTFTFKVTINANVARGSLITNTVTATVGGVPYTAQATVHVRPLYSIYLPLVFRNAP